ncbi:MAG TPA: heme lyase CcmF/NrfE family subunit [Caldilineae bacterium]|nr:heme lyase CcmF/NrfE family subunit [Caldilineae bacterium]
MVNDLGFLALALSALLAAYAAVAAWWSTRHRDERWLESARNAAVSTAPLLTVACAAVVYNLLAGNFQIYYVYNVSARAMPPFLKATALWGGQAGSILFWTWLMSLFAAAVLLRKWEVDRPLLPWVIVVTMLTLLFFQGLSLFVASPFERLWQDPVSGEVVRRVWRPTGYVPLVPLDGTGLNPLLRHPGMIGHPPTLYLGFVGFVIPYAFAMAALITRRSIDDRWIRTTRRWTLVAWLFLSLGLLLGGRWAYDVLGWGGFWGWDPVENAALMPWLTGTAFLHSVMIQEKRGMLKVWNMVLIILTYSLVIFGTFITRSGVISSVHSFTQSAIGPAFFTFITVTFLASLALLTSRLDTLRSENILENFLSREAAFLVNNLLFLGITFAVFWGTISPMVTELITGEKITVGPPYYDQVTGPLFGALVLLMGLAPLLAWRRQSLPHLARKLLWPFIGSILIGIGLAMLGYRSPAALFGFWLVAFVGLITLLEFWKGAQARRRTRGESWPVALARLISRHRRRYGGYMIHLGVLMMALGVIGTHFYQQETEATLALGEQLDFGPYTLQFDNLRAYSLEGGDRQVTEAVLTIYKDGRPVRTLRPRRDFFISAQQPMTIPSVWSRPQEDLYALLIAWETDPELTATFKVYINPLINWLWLGGLTFVLGTVVAAWPEPAIQQRWKLVLQREPMPEVA